MNKLILSGRPTRDPLITYTNGENPKMVAQFTLASNRIYVRQGEQTADFIPCVAFGKQAELIEKYVTKGRLILITGPVRNNDYVNREGIKVYGHQMTVETVELLEKKTGSGADAEAAQETDKDGYMNISEEEMADMPFN